ncbi:MAG: hypothetical protein CW338_02980 [Clostridiales bacterium]|nr:hypothetical protein [Clostridiales bacterium]
MENMKQIHPGTWHAEYDENGVCVSVVYDPSYRELLGYEPCECAGSSGTWIDSVHPEDRERVIALLVACTAKHPEGMDFDTEYRRMTASGYRWFHDYAGYIRREDGSPAHCDGVVFDIQAVVDRNEEFRKLAENNLRVLTLEDNFVSVYDADLETGAYTVYTRRHILGEEEADSMVNNNDFFADTLKNSELVIWPDDREGIVRVLDRAYIRGRLAKENSFDWHYRLITAGGPVWAKMRVTYKDNEKKRIIVGVFGADDEMKAKQLSDVKRSMNMIFSLSDQFDPIIVLDPVTGAYDWLMSVAEDVISNTSMTMHGADLYKNIGIDGASIIHEEDREQFMRFYTRENMMRIAETGITQETENRWFIRTEGRYRWKYNKAVRMIDESGKAFVVVGVIDTTAKKEEEALREMQQEQMRQALETAKIEAGRIDLLGVTIGAARFSYDISAEDEVTAARYADISRDRIGAGYLNGMDWIKLVHPEDHDRVRDAFMATVHDHTCQTPYNITFRMMGTGGKYRWVRSGGNVHRRDDGTGEFYGISLDITAQMEEQQARLLGAVPVSPDILGKSNIGMWAFELDEGQPPRMYADETMLGLLGLEHQIPPEEIYHAWYDHIDGGSYGLVTDAVAKMSAGEHAEVQYPWHHPGGHTMIVRCGGVRNPSYTKGIRIEGTHQDMTQTVRFDEAEVERLRQAEVRLQHEQLRAEVLNYMVDHDDDPIELLKNFAERLRVLIGCDQVIYRDLEETRIMVNSPAIEDTWHVPIEFCRQCQHFDAHHPMYAGGFTEMDNCQLGWQGIPVYHECPIKSSLTRLVFCDGEITGYMAIHFVVDYHHFTDLERATVEEFTRILSISLSRYKARMESRELKLIADMQKQLEQALADAQAANSAKSTFLFNMSHDIRTPMNAITGFTDKAIRHMDDPEVLGESLEKVKTSSEYLLKIVNDILDMAKIESGRLELKEDLHYTDKGSNTLLEVFGAEAARKDIRLHTAYKTTDKYLWIDESRNNQIVANLISNAIKYTSPGGDIWFTVEQFPSSKPGYGRYRVTVKDTGCGMSPEFVSRIFDLFERDESAIRSGAQGTGLGMAIVKRLIDAMGGVISVQSEPGKGTTVVYETDQRIATPEEIRAAMAQERGSVLEKVEKNFTGKRILVVEDNPLNLEIAVDLLEEKGLIVDTASDGSIALQKMQAVADRKDYTYYAAVLMDVQMPVMNGYEATRAIRAIPAPAHIHTPIIAMTANAFEEDRQNALDSGMDDHIAKPINVQKLFETLAKFM